MRKKDVLSAEVRPDYTAMLLAQAPKTFDLLGPRGAKCVRDTIGEAGIAALLLSGELAVVALPDGTASIAHRARGELEKDLQDSYLAAFDRPRADGIRKSGPQWERLLSAAWFYREDTFVYVAWCSSLPSTIDRPKNVRMAYELALAVAGSSDKEILSKGDALAVIMREPHLGDTTPEFARRPVKRVQGGFGE